MENRFIVLVQKLDKEFTPAMRANGMYRWDDLESANESANSLTNNGRQAFIYDLYWTIDNQLAQNERLAKAYNAIATLSREKRALEEELKRLKHPF